ncbi:DUF4330 family protein [Salinibaculum rarum]|uniref:DUF4330 family protein n=1 Tax=Salinibaculum rarum TaxID=3058903 RepID=UPI0034E96E46
MPAYYHFQYHMQIIDSEGRLLGYVNVVDALVLLFVLAVLVAGVALVTGAGDQLNQVEPSSEKVTVQVVTTVSEPVSGHVNEGGSVQCWSTDGRRN